VISWFLLPSCGTSGTCASLGFAPTSFDDIPRSRSGELAHLHKLLSQKDVSYKLNSGVAVSLNLSISRRARLACRVLVLTHGGVVVVEATPSKAISSLKHDDNRIVAQPLRVAGECEQL
jgi:hypothetical protein